MKKRSLLLGGAAAVAAPAVLKFSGNARAATADASRLTGELMPFGGERAASASGHIPAWTGGMPVAPLVNGIPQPMFMDEQPSFTVTAANMSQYSDMLTLGLQQMLQRYGSAGFVVNVYPTHRTAAAPQWVYDNTAKNVTRAVLNADGNGFTGAVGGIPFPILDPDPAIAGAQAIWNFQLRWVGTYQISNAGFFIVGNGRITLTNAGTATGWHPYYDEGATPDNFGGHYYWALYEYHAPANVAGGASLATWTTNPDAQADQAWTYLVGEGRVRQAPSAEYDIPQIQSDGAINYDESFLFLGATDRYTWKLIGKKEMIVPYNQEKSYHAASAEDLFHPQFINPDLTRFEIHRVWVVEAHVAPGARMTEPVRRFFIDEDTWILLLSEAYDDQGNFWKCGVQYALNIPALPAIITAGLVVYNLQSDQYVYNGGLFNSTEAYGGGLSYEPIPRTRFLPQSMSNAGGL